MALGNNANKIYLSVADGKITQRAKEGDQGAIKRIKSDGGIVFEKKYSYISGILTGISTRTTQYNGSEIKEWQFEITDGQENYQLQIQYDSRYATSLINALSNPIVDFSQPITITPWMKVVNDKKKTNCYLKQNDTSIDWYFTKDNPNGMPELKEITFKGKQTWDSYDRMQFLEKYIETKIKPQLNNPFPTPASQDIPATTHYNDSPEYANPESFSQAPDDDDLPF